MPAWLLSVLSLIPVVARFIPAPKIKPGPDVPELQPLVVENGKVRPATPKDLAKPKGQ